MAFPSLDGRTFRDVTPQHDGDVGGETVFDYRQGSDGTVSATYRGGSIRLGYLVGTRAEDTLDFRYAHLTTEGQTAAGHCASRLEQLDDGSIRIHETWEWESRPGTGSSVIEEVRRGA